MGFGGALVSPHIGQVVGHGDQVGAFLEVGVVEAGANLTDDDLGVFVVEQLLNGHEDFAEQGAAQVTASQVAGFELLSPFEAGFVGAEVCVEAQKRYTKQYKSSIHRWSYGRLIDQIASKANQVGLVVEETNQPPTTLDRVG